MKKDRIYLGIVKNELVSECNRSKGNLSFIQGNRIYLKKHSWDCGWYWGFGYLEGYGLYTHFDSVFLQGNGGLQWTAHEIFEYTILDDHKLWILKDLFKQAYGLKESAVIYQHGGHCTSGEDVEIIHNKTMADILNKDVERILDHIWKLLEKWSDEYEKAKRKKYRENAKQKKTKGE